MKHYIYFPLLLICIFVNAQTNVTTFKVSDVDSTFLPKLTGEFFYESTKYIGDQYFNKVWAEGDVLLTTGTIVPVKALKYNGLFDELIWLNNTSFGKFKLDKSYISDFWLKNIQGVTSHFKRVNVSEPNTPPQPDIFVEIEAEGRISLYVQRKIRITGSELLNMNNVICSFDDIAPKPVYYIKLPTNHYLKMSKISRRAFLKLFPEKKKAIGKIIKDNHLNVKIESDFVKTIELMNKEEIL